MSEYRLLCPQCGWAFKEEAKRTECPACRAALLDAGISLPADIRNLPERLDVDELLRGVLAEQKPGEDIDAALARIARRDHPVGYEGLCRLIGQQLTTWQGLKGITRQEAAEQLAETESELKVQQGGLPEIRTTAAEARVEGLEVLSPEGRRLLLRGVERAIRQGAPLKDARFQAMLGTGKGRTGCTSKALAVALLAALLSCLVYQAVSAV